MTKIGTRVVLLDGNGIPLTGLGTVVDINDTRGLALVDWDHGPMSMESLDNIVSQQALKAMFKHGPKLNKKGELYAKAPRR